MDLLLAGDNALVIALAVRSLPPRERRIGIIGGATAAVVLRIGLTTVAAHVLTIHYLQIAGGLAILWIARESADRCQRRTRGGGTRRNVSGRRSGTSWSPT